VKPGDYCVPPAVTFKRFAFRLHGVLFVPCDCQNKQGLLHSRYCWRILCSALLHPVDVWEVPSSSGLGSPVRVIVFSNSFTSLEFVMETEYVLREVWTEFLCTVYMDCSPKNDKGVELVD